MHFSMKRLWKRDTAPTCHLAYYLSFGQIAASDYINACCQSRHWSLKSISTLFGLDLDLSVRVPSTDISVSSPSSSRGYQDSSATAIPCAGVLLWSSATYACLAELILAVSPLSHSVKMDSCVSLAGLSPAIVRTTKSYCQAIEKEILLESDFHQRR